MDDIKGNIDEILFESIASESHAISAMSRVLINVLTNGDPGNFIEEMERVGLNPKTAAGWNAAINRNLRGSRQSIDIFLNKLKMNAVKEASRVSAIHYKKNGVEGLEAAVDESDVETFIMQILKR
jgi:hypothetical protein